jgi:HEPN domain-containing protein
MTGQKTSRKSKKSVEVWMTVARGNLRSANGNLSFDPPEYLKACIDAQQSIEYAFKSYLLLNCFEFKKTHDLESLNSECTKIDPEFQIFENKLSPLTYYYKTLKYPPEEDEELPEYEDSLPTLDETIAAYNLAHTIYNFVATKIETIKKK